MAIVMDLAITKLSREQPRLATECLEWMIFDRDYCQIERVGDLNCLRPGEGVTSAYREHGGMAMKIVIRLVDSGFGKHNLLLRKLSWLHFASASESLVL